MCVHEHETMGASAPESAGRRTEQALGDAGGGAPLGDFAEDAFSS
ncbi:MAG: hypothetical protein ACI9DF_004324, partial [Verrucomicrobiales bacterium]